MPQRDLSQLSSETWDLAVIGGGILGAGVARDAALRGLRVALVEQADIASGTSSRSTKLIHGGFRYLEHWQFGLVAEACRERALLQTLAPHLVHPLPFLLPVYTGDPRPLWKIRAGMVLYDLMAGWKRETRHRHLSPAEARAAEPTLEPQGLRGAISFYDCQMDDARLCLETLLDAMQHGAVAANYCELVGLETEHERITRAVVRDKIRGGTQLIRARVFLNAAGPWVEKIATMAPWKEPRVALSPTKGVHLVLPRLLQQHGVYFQSRRDDRMIFLLPYGEQTLLGATDTNYDDEPSQARADRDDVEYLFARLREVMPHCPLSPNDIVTSFAGVRPLLRANSSDPSHRPREHRLIRSGSNLLTIAGGKYTTFRAISEQVVNAVYRVLNQQETTRRRASSSLTATTPLPNRRPPPSGLQLSHSPDVWQSDIEFACRDEMALTVSDVMRRRTGLALSASGDERTAEFVSRWMASELDWSDDFRLQSLNEYLQERQRNHGWPPLPRS